MSLNPYAELFFVNQETKRFFQLEIILNVLVSSSRFIWIPMLWVYGVMNIDSGRQNLKGLAGLNIEHFEWEKMKWIGL